MHETLTIEILLCVSTFGNLSCERMEDAKVDELPTSSSLPNLPKLTELEKLLLADPGEDVEIIGQLLDKLKLQPAIPKNYSVVDNIYRYLAVNAADLQEYLCTLHRELVNTMNKINSDDSDNCSSGLSGLNTLPRELLPMISDYGHSGHTVETVTPNVSKFERYCQGRKIGKIVQRFILSIDGNQEKLLLHGPQSVTYFDGRSPTISRELFLYGKEIVTETNCNFFDLNSPMSIEIDDAAIATGTTNVVNFDIFDIFFFPAIWNGPYNRGSLEYNNSKLKAKVQIKSELTSRDDDGIKFAVVPPPLAEVSAFSKCQLASPLIAFDLMFVDNAKV